MADDALQLPALTISSSNSGMSPTITKTLPHCEAMNILYQAFFFFPETISWYPQAEITRWEYGMSQAGAWFSTSLLSIPAIADLDAPLSHCIKVLKPHAEWIRSALPSADGRLLLTCSDDHVRFSLHPNQKVLCFTYPSTDSTYNRYRICRT